MTTIGANLTQTLYDQNMKTLKPGHMTAMKFANLKMGAAGVNDIESQDNSMKKLTPAFLKQAELSTWYQNSPWEILTESNKYGVGTLGGPINFEQPPGYRPGNILLTPKPKVPKLHKERFTNAETSSPELDFFNTTGGKVVIAVIILLVLALGYYVFYKNKQVVEPYTPLF